jgi:hypothetical protein
LENPLFCEKIFLKWRLKMTERRVGMTEKPNGFDELNPCSKTGAALYFMDMLSMLW